MQISLSEGVILWILGIAVAILKFVVGWQVKTLLDHKVQLARIQDKIDIFWNGLSPKLAKILHSPHTPELDALIEKYVENPQNLTKTELHRLMGILHEIENDTQAPKGERVGAALWHIMLKDMFKEFTIEVKYSDSSPLPVKITHRKNNNRPGKRL